MPDEELDAESRARLEQQQIDNLQLEIELLATELAEKVKAAAWEPHDFVVGQRRQITSDAAEISEYLKQRVRFLRGLLMERIQEKEKRQGNENPEGQKIKSAEITSRKLTDQIRRQTQGIKHLKDESAEEPSSRNAERSKNLGLSPLSPIGKGSTLGEIPRIDPISVDAQKVDVMAKERTKTPKIPELSKRETELAVDSQRGIRDIKRGNDGNPLFGLFGIPHVVIGVKERDKRSVHKFLTESGYLLAELNGDRYAVKPEAINELKTKGVEYKELIRYPMSREDRIQIREDLKKRGTLAPI